MFEIKEQTYDEITDLSMINSYFGTKLHEDITKYYSAFKEGKLYTDFLIYTDKIELGFFFRDIASEDKDVINKVLNY